MQKVKDLVNINGSFQGALKQKNVQIVQGSEYFNRHWIFYHL